MIRALALIALLAPAARADDAPRLACASARDPGLAEGPIAIGLYDADLGTGRDACPRNELHLAERLGATVDTKDLYGGVRADTLLSGGYRLRRRLQIFGALEMVHWELVQDATIKGRAIGLGQLTIGLQGLAFESGRLAVSVLGRVLVPTASWTPSVQTTGAEVAVAALYRPHRLVELHGQLAGDFTAGISGGPPAVRGGTTLGVGVQYAPARWFGVAVDLAVVLGHRAALDAFLPALALRFRAWRGLGLELDVTAPLAGADRRLALAALRVGYRF